MLVPNADVSVSYEDIDSADAGRDEKGYMHRIMVRCKVPSWTFTYDYLTEAERQYMEQLFGEAATFDFTCPDRMDASKSTTTQCYRSGYGIAWRNARTGLWSGYSFRIIGC